MTIFLVAFAGVGLALGVEIGDRTAIPNNHTASITAASVSTGNTSSPGTSSHFANQTSNVAPNATSPTNITRLPDTRNATECWPYYWSLTKASEQWVEDHRTWYTTTSTWKVVRSTTVAPHRSDNGTWTTYCDGLPRFQNASEQSSAIITLSPPVTVEQIIAAPTFRDDDVPNPYDYRNWPSCNITGTEECKVIGSMFVSSLRRSLDQWSSKSVLTISVPGTPTAVIVNGKTTPLTAAPGQLPALPLQGTSFPASPDGRWSIHPAYSFFADTTITPGQEVTFTWNYGDIVSKPFGPWVQGCSRPSNVIDEPACSTTKRCTIQADHVELIYFPPPSTTRDMCAITSADYDRNSQSLYSHPHVSTVINSTTFWMDKVYVRYNTISAYKWCSFDNGLGQSTVGVGATYTSTHLEIESRDASTMCGWQYNDRPYKVIGATPYPLNFADLNGPVPLSAYTCVPGVGRDAIIQDRYLPALAVPPQLRALDPEWADCVPFFEGTPDPPIALESVPVLTENEPTATATPATPGKSVPSGHPKPTGDSGMHPVRSSVGGVPTSHAPVALPSVPVLTTSLTVRIPLTTGQPQLPDLDTDPLISSPGNDNAPRPNPEAAIPAPSPVTIIADQPIFISPYEPAKIIIGDPASPSATTITPGDAAIVISSTTLSVSSSETGTSLIVSVPRGLIPFTTIDGQPVFIDPANPDRIVFGDPNNQAHSLTTVSITNGIAVIDGTTISIPVPATLTPTGAIRPIETNIAGFGMQLLADGKLLITTNDGTGYSITAGGEQVSVDGHTVFFRPDGKTVVVDGKIYEVDIESITSAEVPAAANVERVVVVDPDGRSTTIRVKEATIAVNEGDGGTRLEPTRGTGASKLGDKPGLVGSPTVDSSNGGQIGSLGASSTSKKSAATRTYGPAGLIPWMIVVLIFGTFV